MHKRCPQKNFIGFGVVVFCLFVCFETLGTGRKVKIINIVCKRAPRSPDVQWWLSLASVGLQILS